MSATMIIRLDNDFNEQLERLDAATRRSRSILAAESIRELIGERHVNSALPTH